jgi:hypothetical protein
MLLGQSSNQKLSSPSGSFIPRYVAVNPAAPPPTAASDIHTGSKATYASNTSIVSYVEAIVSVAVSSSLYIVTIVASLVATTPS